MFTRNTLPFLPLASDSIIVKRLPYTDLAMAGDGDVRRTHTKKIKCNNSSGVNIIII